MTTVDESARRATAPRWLDLNADEEPGDVALPVETRVKQGMALLDERHGPEWIHKIDVDTLDINDGCQCVLGQTYEDQRTSHITGYGIAIDLLDIRNGGEEFGFLPPTFRESAALTTAWRLAILARRAEVTP